MKNIGFKQLLPDELQAPIIITFMQPKNSNFNFDQFYEALSQKDFLIYPGKLTVADTFRIGCIGNLNQQDMTDTIKAVKEVVSELNINHDDINSMDEAFITSSAIDILPCYWDGWESNYTITIKLKNLYNESIKIK